MRRYAIIGFGCGGYHGAKAIRQLDSGGEIHAFDRLNAPPFNPMLTTYYAANRISRSGAFPFGELESICNDLHLHFHGAAPVQRVTEERTVILADGTQMSFDRILLAVGANAFLPPLRGLPDRRVMLMRTYADAQRFRENLVQYPLRRAVVIGGSMVGIKVAELLYTQGAAVTIADGADWLFPLAALPRVGREIERRLVKRGISFAWGAVVQKITPAGVLLSSGVELPADMIFLCIGTRPDLKTITRDDGTFILDVGRGIKVNPRMETSCPGIYAAGDCCEGTNLQTGETLPIGLWANAGYQGEAAGRSMAGYPEPYAGSIVHNITHFMGMDFIGLGDNRLHGKTVTWGNLNNGPYIEAVVEGRRLQCVNILDCYPVSGVLKSLMLAQWSRPGCSLTPAQLAVLLRQGISWEWIEKIGGIYHA